MDEKKPHLWHSTSRPPSATSPPFPQSTSSTTPLHSRPYSQHQLLYAPNPQPIPTSNSERETQRERERMVSALPTRGLQEEHPPTLPTPFSLPPQPTAFSSMPIPLLDPSAPDHVLPPILPQKRTYATDDPSPSTIPSTTSPSLQVLPPDWNQTATTHQSAKIPTIRQSTHIRTSTPYPHHARTAAPSPATHQIRHHPTASLADFVSTPSGHQQQRLPVATAAYSALVKHPSDTMLYHASDPSVPSVDATFRVPGSADAKHQALHDALSRPLAYGDALGVLQHGAAPGSAGGFLGSSSLAGPHSFLPGTSSTPRGRRVSPCDDSFVIAAETGARAQLAVDSSSGDGVFETYELGISIVQSSKLYANQRRSNRLLPGGSDSTTAACYMIGGTADSVLSPLLARVSPCDPREERCKAVERVLKDKTRGAICALNGENPREARADNLAAVRICEVVADILVAFSSKRLYESRKQLFATVARQEQTIKEVTEELEEQKRQTERWRKEALELGGGRGEHVGGRSGEQGGDEGRDGVNEEHNIKDA